MVGGDDPEQDFFQSWPRGIAMIIDEERCIRCNLCVERCPTNCITMDRLELERFTPDGKVLLESYKDNVLGQIGQQALEIDFLKGCLQRIEQQRMLQALTGNPPSTGRSKKK